MKKLYFIPILIALIAIGCQKPQLNEETSTIQSDNTNTSADADIGEHHANGPMRAIELGKKLNNPYSVANMELALGLLRDSLSRPNQTGVSLDAVNAVEIYTTNLYVRLCATDDQSNRLLRTDPNLSLYSSPRDHSVAEIGNHYVDTIGVIDTRYQWWYATVEPDFRPADGIHCEVLDELFIPRNSKYYTDAPVDQDNVSSADVRIMDDNFVTCLLIASFNLTGNQDELRSAANSGQSSFMGAPTRSIATRAYYTPRGRVTVEAVIDGVVKQIPVGNVRVRIARWFEEDSFYTNNNGYYVSNKSWDEFWGGFDYSVFMTGQLEGCRYTMVDVFELMYPIPKQRIEGLDIVFGRNSKFCGPAMIQAATTEYFVKCVQQSGIHPIYDRLNVQVTKSNNVTGATYPGLPWGDIVINYNINNDYYRSNMSTTWHELAHASFIKNMATHRGEVFANNFWSIVRNTEAGHIAGTLLSGQDPYGKKGDVNWEYIAIAEGWAFFIEDFLLQKHYGRRSFSKRDQYFVDDFPYNYQMMFKELEKEAKIPITDLQRALTVNTLREFKDKLKSFYVGSDDIIPKFPGIYDRPTISGGKYPGIIGGGGTIGGYQPIVKKRSVTIEKIMEKYL